MKTTAADRYFSLCVRERADWKCERCGTQYVYPTSSRGFDCAHYETRDNWATRFDPQNAFALCRGCHGYFDRGRRIEFKGLYFRTFGQEALEALEWRSQQSATLGKDNRHNEAEIAKHYKAQYSAMLAVRSKGAVGRLEFFGF